MEERECKERSQQEQERREKAQDRQKREHEKQAKERAKGPREKQIDLANDLWKYVRSWEQMRRSLLTTLPHPDHTKKLTVQSIANFNTKRQWKQLVLVSFIYTRSNLFFNVIKHLALPH